MSLAVPSRRWRWPDGPLSLPENTGAIEQSGRGIRLDPSRTTEINTQGELRIFWWPFRSFSAGSSFAHLLVSQQEEQVVNVSVGGSQGWTVVFRRDWLDFVEAAWTKGLEHN